MSQEITTTHDIQNVYNHLRIAFKRGILKDIKQRKIALKKLLSWVKANDNRIKEAMFNDYRKPAPEVDITEIYPVITELKHAINHLRDWTKPSKIDAPLSLMGTTSYIQYEPKGVCLIIAPWNYPFNLCLGPLISCIAAGNTAYIKPSEMTPHTSKLISELILEIFDDNEVAVALGGVEVSQELLKLDFDHIFFTGSPRVGKIVMKAAAAHLTSVTLELGGKSPVIVDQNSNLDDVAAKLAWGKFINNGQTCIAPDYVLVHKSIEQVFLKRLSSEVDKQFKGSESTIQNSDGYGRLVNTAFFDRISGLLENALNKGADIVYGSDSIREENFFPPVIVNNVPDTCDLMEEEIFGPILPVRTYETLDEAIDFINAKPKPLALYYFGNSRKNSRKVLEQTSSGTACVNDAIIQFGHVNFPFGGVNNSGIGKSHGKFGFLEFSNTKGVLKQRVGFTSTKLIFPPYTNWKKASISLLKKYL